MADEAAAKWRLRRMNRPKGAYYVLETGRNETRVTMSPSTLTRIGRGVLTRTGHSSVETV